MLFAKFVKTVTYRCLGLKKYVSSVESQGGYCLQQHKSKHTKEKWYRDVLLLKDSNLNFMRKLEFNVV